MFIAALFQQQKHRQHDAFVVPPDLVPVDGNTALCVEPAGLCGRCTGVAVPLRVGPSPTGLPSKRGPGLGLICKELK